MHLTRLTLFTLVLCLSVAASHGNLYDVPDPTIEVFSPRGLRVSIPDALGIRIFAFHGSINKELEPLEAGDMSRDILRKTGNRWVFEDKTAYLAVGDTLSYWLFVIKDNLGYRRELSTYQVTETIPAPSGFHLSRKPPKHGQGKPSQSIPVIDQIHVSSPCKCPAVKPEVVCPTEPSIPFTTTTTSPIPEILPLWTETLLNITEENVDLRTQIKLLAFKNDVLVKLVEKTKNPDLKKLKLSGRVPVLTEADEFVDTFLREKLNIKDMAVSAERRSDNTIVFEMESYPIKLNVLFAANQKLVHSKIILTDPMY